MTALMLATAIGRDSTAMFLIAKGAKCDARSVHGDTPLMIAAKNVQFKCLKLIIEAGAMIDVENVHGDTALRILTKVPATNVEKSKCLETLIKHSAAMHINDINNVFCCLARCETAPETSGAVYEMIRLEHLVYGIPNANTAHKVIIDTKAALSILDRLASRNVAPKLQNWEVEHEKSVLTFINQVLRSRNTIENYPFPFPYNKEASVHQTCEAFERRIMALLNDASK